jgi:hypothetical protein
MTTPQLTLDIKIGDSAQTLRWTYGLSQDISRVVPDLESIHEMLKGSPDLRDYVIRRLLTDKKGFIFEASELRNPEDLEELSVDHQLAMLKWVAEHLTDFFVKSTEILRQQGVTLEASVQSKPGFADSVSKTASAGPGDASLVTSATSTGDTASAS